MDNDDLVYLIAAIGNPGVDNEGFYGTYDFRVGHRLYHARGAIGDITTLCFSEVNVITGEARSAICAQGTIKGRKGEYSAVGFPIDTLDFSDKAEEFLIDEDAIALYQKVRELVEKNIH